MLQDILSRFQYFNGKRIDDIAVTPFLCKEDGEAYNVWRLEGTDTDLVLKKAKAFELSVYRHFFGVPMKGAPQFIESVSLNEEDYFLMTYAEGADLCRATRPALIKALDALISLQDEYWDNTALETVAYTFDESLECRVKRGEYLGDPIIEASYARFLHTYQRVPRTLCHDDLLPFNILVGKKDAILIDWEYGGILPYLSPLARLIAHVEESENTFFYMTEADKNFTVDYYYDHFVKNKMISYETYRRDLDDFLLYEYCEWIMLGHRFNDTLSERYIAYRHKALQHIHDQRRYSS